MLEDFQYRILRRISPHEPTHMSGEAYRNKSKIKVLLGEDVLQQVKGKVVIDFGCGEGIETIELARNGAAKVIGIDVQERLLRRAKENAIRAGLGALCEFCGDTDRFADIIVSIDSFEHFDNPEIVLEKMDGLLKPGGAIIGSFGPPWYHPYGGHLFSVFPWAHLVFAEKALMRWRSNIRNDGARCFSEVEGGLNQMTIRRFERMVRASRFYADFETVPIRKLAAIHNRLTRECTTSIVRFKLVKPPGLARQPQSRAS